MHFTLNFISKAIKEYLYGLKTVLSFDIRPSVQCSNIDSINVHHNERKVDPKLRKEHKIATALLL